MKQDNKKASLARKPSRQRQPNSYIFPWSGNYVRTRNY